MKRCLASPMIRKSIYTYRRIICNFHGNDAEKSAEMWAGRVCVDVGRQRDFTRCTTYLGAHYAMNLIRSRTIREQVSGRKYSRLRLSARIFIVLRKNIYSIRVRKVLFYCLKLL